MQIYIFDVLKQEVGALENKQRALQGLPALDENGQAVEQQPVATSDAAPPVGAAPSNGGAPAAAGGRSSLLAPGQNASHLPASEAEPVRSSTSALADEEAALEKEFETVADRMQYMAKRKVLGRFGAGVSGYLIASCLVLLLPIFINSYVQNAIVTLQFVVHYIFLLALVYIFAPVPDSPYILVGGDADNATEYLATELAVVEADDEEAAAPGGAASAGAPGGSRGQAGPRKQEGAAPSAAGTFTVADDDDEMEDIKLGAGPDSSPPGAGRR